MRSSAHQPASYGSLAMDFSSIRSASDMTSATQRGAGSAEMFFSMDLS